MSSIDQLEQCPGLSGLYPYMRPLSLADVKSCVEVENAFIEQERCSEEKFIYRLSQTPELSLGLFVRTEKGDRHIGHVIGNRTSFDGITEESMGMPDNWRSLAPNEQVVRNGKVVGNEANGNIIAIHSVVTIPEYQGKGIGKAMVKAYIQYMREQRVPEKRFVLIAHDYLVKFYESAGFHNRGKSPCQFAGSVWYDLALDI
ncbi:hypothetical protein N7462_001352 [Penicillium macrosclerotiorum]|uniref:uncharacterized protein n=1 Tax=Penicillium macrosclerotiorum TaxID=303699 RepID=UPI002547A2EA|nr:uncharacterized protein N7462_001352 [Penicillium macrosclerotiorum]KAJ5691929.1 hypothetical protein N7462_001352 [Penicillium macrosclerotiorum]